MGGVSSVFVTYVSAVNFSESSIASMSNDLSKIASLALPMPSAFYFLLSGSQYLVWGLGRSVNDEQWRKKKVFSVHCFALRVSLFFHIPKSFKSIPPCDVQVAAIRAFKVNILIRTVSKEYGFIYYTWRSPKVRLLSQDDRFKHEWRQGYLQKQRSGLGNSVNPLLVLSH